MKISLAVFLATLFHVCTAEIVAETQPAANVVEGQADQKVDAAEKNERGEFERVLYGDMYGGYGDGNCCKLVCEKPRLRRSYYSSMMMSRRTKETEKLDEESERGERALHGKGYGGYGYGYGGYGYGYGYGSMGDCRYDCSACAPPPMCFSSSTVSECDCDCRCCPVGFGGVECSCDCDCPHPRPPIYRSKAMMMGGGSNGYYDDGNYRSDDYGGGYRSKSMMSGSSAYNGGSSSGGYDDDDDYVDDDESPDGAPAVCCEPEIVCNPVEAMEPDEDDYKYGYEYIEVDKSGSLRERKLQDGEVKPNGRVGDGHYPQGPGIGKKDCQRVGCLIYGNPNCEKEEPEDSIVSPPPPGSSSGRSGAMTSGGRSYGYPQSIEHDRE